MKSRDGPLSNASDDVVLISEFWNQLHCSDEIGAANREALEELERKVTDCLAGKPRDLLRARSYTAQAMLLITGQNY